MEKYKIVYDNSLSVFYSNSRDSKKHLRDHGGNVCKVFKNNVLISMAIRTEDDKIVNATI